MKGVAAQALNGPPRQEETRLPACTAAAPPRAAPVSIMKFSPSLAAPVLAAGLVLGLGGCTERDGEFITVGTAPAGGTFYVVGNAIASVLDANSGDHGWRVSTQGTQGSNVNIRLLVDKEIELGMSNAAITYFAVRGEGHWDQPMEVRSVMTMAPNVALFLTPASSEVESIADLAGKRVVIGPAGAGFETFVSLILEGHGVSMDDITPLEATQAAAVDMLADGSAAAAFLGGGIPVASISQAVATQNIRFVPFDPEVREQLIAEFPFFRPAVIPGGTYTGHDEDFHGLDVGSMHLITAASMDEELVYNLTKTLYENREQVEHPAGRSINPDNVTRPTGTDFHPGAIRYFQEIGIWPEAGGE